MLKTLVDVADGLHVESLLLDTILWKGNPWLVVGRRRIQNGETRTRLRIARPKLFHFQPQQSHQLGADYILNVAIPKPILDGQSVSGSAVEFECVEAPEVETPLSTILNR
jgi:hypothetical protein